MVAFQLLNLTFLLSTFQISLHCPVYIIHREGGKEREGERKVELEPTHTHTHSHVHVQLIHDVPYNTYTLYMYKVYTCTVNGIVHVHVHVSERKASKHFMRHRKHKPSFAESYKHSHMNSLHEC